MFSTIFDITLGQLSRLQMNAAIPMFCQFLRLKKHDVLHQRQKAFELAVEPSCQWLMQLRNEVFWRKKSLCSPSTCWTDLCDVNYPTVEGTKTNWWLRFNPFETYQKQPSDVSSFPPQSGRGRKWKKKHVRIMRSKSDTNGPVSTMRSLNQSWNLKNLVLKPYGCFRKWWSPQIIHFDRVFHYKPSILGYPNFWKHPYHLSSENIKRKTNLHRRPISITCFFFKIITIYLWMNQQITPWSNSPPMARTWHCSGNCTLWSPLTTPVHPILGAKKRGRSVLWVCT